MSFRRLLILLLSGGWVLALAWPSGAHEAPDHDDAIDEGRQDLRSGWAPEELQSLADNLGVPLESAVERVGLEPHMLALIERARVAFPRTFGGYAISRTGPAAISLFFTAAPEASALAVMADFPLPERVTTRTVALSEQALKDLWQTVQRQGDALLLAGVHYTRTELVGDDNVVEIRVNGLTEEVRAAVARLVGTSGIRLVEESSSLQTTNHRCNNRLDCLDLRGGLVVSTRQGNCTTGFTAVAGFVRYMITTAHCGRRSQDYIHRGEVIGQNDLNADLHFGFDGLGRANGFDATRVPDTSGPISLWARIYASPAGRDTKVLATEAGGQANHPRGLAFCYSGFATAAARGDDGPTCGIGGFGPVNLADPDTFEGGRVYFVRGLRYFNKVCAIPGDSGAPVYSQFILRGMVVGRTGDIPPSCFTYYHIASDVWESLGVSVLTTS